MLARFQEWRTIGDVVLEVELMREFVQHNVATRVATLAPAWDVVPRNDDCTKPKTGFAQASVVTFFPNAVTKVALTTNYVWAGVDENGSQSRVIIRVTSKEKNRGIRCDRDADLIRELESAAALEALL